MQSSLQVAIIEDHSNFSTLVYFLTFVLSSQPMCNSRQCRPIYWDFFKKTCKIAIFPLSGPDTTPGHRQRRIIILGPACVLWLCHLAMQEARVNTAACFGSLSASDFFHLGSCSLLIDFAAVCSVSLKKSKYSLPCQELSALKSTNGFCRLTNTETLTVARCSKTF